MRQFLILGSLALLAGATATAERPAERKLTEADGRKWAARVRKAVARDNWSVAVRGMEITVRRDRPVAMARVAPNSPPGAKPIPDGERTIRFVLRFGPKLPVAEYDRRAAVNATSAKEYDRLHRAVGLPHKFDEFIATTPQEKERVRAFRAAVAKLPRHALPDLYTPDHGISLFHPWDGWSSPADEAVAAECQDVQDTLERLFGMYSPAAAARGQGVGQYLPEPRR